MYKLIDAKLEHGEQIVNYFSITFYWKEFVEGNTLNLSYEEFMLKWIILPRIKFTKVLVSTSDSSKIYGCLIAAASDELANMPDYTPYLHHNVLEIFKSWFSYSTSDNFILELYAVDKNLRERGYGSLMLGSVENMAKQCSKKIISCFVWTCFYDSIIATVKKDFTIIDYLKFAKPIDIGLLYLEKSSEHFCRKDYFQSNEYINTKGLLLNI